MSDSTERCESQFRWPQPGELWSLWDMWSGDLILFVRSMQYISTFGMELTSHISEIEESDGNPWNFICDAEINLQLAYFISRCRDFGLNTTLAAAERLGHFLEKYTNENEYSVAMGGTVPKVAHDMLTDVLRRFSDEAKSHKLLVINPTHARFWNQEEPLFGPKVEANFPSSAYDIEEAGKCITVERWTAAVLHLMRALEPALVALQADVQAQVAKDQWHQMIIQIGKAVDLMESDRRTSAAPKHTRTATKEEIAWWSDVATHFRYLKNAWRNYAAHGKEKYDEERAMRIYHNVRDFMIEIATKLKE